MRTLFVWVADLALYYSPLGGSGKVGEQWDSHSWMQVRVDSLLNTSRSVGRLSAHVFRSVMTGYCWLTAACRPFLGQPI